MEREEERGEIRERGGVMEWRGRGYNLYARSPCRVITTF